MSSGWLRVSPANRAAPATQGGLGAVADGVGGIEEIERHQRADALDTGNGQRERDLGDTVRHRKARGDDLAGIGVVDAHQRLAVARAGHQALVIGEGAHGRAHVAAVAGEIDAVIDHADLGERVVDVGIGAGRGADDADLRQRRDAPAHTVELPFVGIGRPQHRGEESRPEGLVLRQVATVQHKGLGRAAAHEGGGNGDLTHVSCSSGVAASCASSASQLARMWRRISSAATAPSPQAMASAMRRCSSSAA